MFSLIDMSWRHYWNSKQIYGSYSKPYIKACDSLLILPYVTFFHVLQTAFLRSSVDVEQFCAPFLESSWNKFSDYLKKRLLLGRWWKPIKITFSAFYQNTFFKPQGTSGVIFVRKWTPPTPSKVPSLYNFEFFLFMGLH